MSAVLISADLFEHIAYDNALLIEMAPSEGRAFLEHEGVTYCALLGVSA